MPLTQISITFQADGEPKAQPRPRAFAKRFGTVVTARIYTPGTAEAWKSQIAIAARPHVPKEPLLGPIRVDVTFWFPRPSNHYRTGKFAGQLKEDAPRFHTVKPDRDNLDKALLDCLCLVGFFRDDSQVVGGEIWKLYVTQGSSSFSLSQEGRRPGATIRIETLGEVTAAADSGQQLLEVR